MAVGKRLEGTAGQTRRVGLEFTVVHEGAQGGLQGGADQPHLWPSTYIVKHGVSIHAYCCRTVCTHRRPGTRLPISSWQKGIYGRLLAADEHLSYVLLAEASALGVSGHADGLGKPRVFSTSPKLLKNDNMHINPPPFLARIMVTRGQSGKPLTVGCVCTLAVFLSLSSYVPCEGLEWRSPLPKCLPLRSPRPCPRYVAMNTGSDFLGRICRSTCNFWYNRETLPIFPRPKF